MVKKNNKFLCQKCSRSYGSFIIQNRLQSEEDLKKFNLDGYNYSSEKSVKVSLSLLGNNYIISCLSKTF